MLKLGLHHHLLANNLKVYRKANKQAKQIQFNFENKTLLSNKL